MFLDWTDDQTAYLLYASDNNQNFKISQMDSDYYNVTEVVAELEGALTDYVWHTHLILITMIGATLEAPGMVKRDDVCLSSTVSFLTLTTSCA